MIRGYVQEAVTIPKNSLKATAFYGVSSTNVITDEILFGFQNFEETDLQGIFTFDCNNEYIVIAYPRTLGSFTTFKINGFPVSFPKTDMLVQIDGINQGYKVHVSEYKQNGQDIVVTIDK